MKTRIQWSIKSKLSKAVGQTNITVRTEVAEYIFVRQFVANMLKHRILFKDILKYGQDILTFVLGIYFRDALLITLCLVVIGLSISKIRWIR